MSANDHKSTKGGSSFGSPGTGRGPTDSQSPRSRREGNADPYANNRNTGRGGKEDLLRPFKPGK